MFHQHLPTSSPVINPVVYNLIISIAKQSESAVVLMDSSNRIRFDNGYDCGHRTAKKGEGPFTKADDQLVASLSDEAILQQIYSWINQEYKKLCPDDFTGYFRGGFIRGYMKGLNNRILSRQKRKIENEIENNEAVKKFKPNSSAKKELIYQTLNKIAGPLSADCKKGFDQALTDFSEQSTSLQTKEDIESVLNQVLQTQTNDYCYGYFFGYRSATDKSPITSEKSTPALPLEHSTSMQDIQQPTLSLEDYQPSLPTVSQFSLSDKNPNMQDEEGLPSHLNKYKITPPPSASGFHFFGPTNITQEKIGKPSESPYKISHLNLHKFS